MVPSECEAAPRGAGGLDEGRVATAGTSVATAALVAVTSLATAGGACFVETCLGRLDAEV